MSDTLFDFDSDFGTRYDDFVRRTIFGYEALFPMVLALLQTRLGEAAQVLVVGSGTGAELLTFGRRMPGWTFTGVDPSEQMIRMSRANIEQAGIAGRVRLHAGTVQGLPAGEKYDAATSILVMHLLADNGAKLDFLQSIADRLKPGASLVLVDHHGDPQSAEFRDLLAGWQNYQVLMGLPSQQADTVLAQAKQTQHFISESRTLALLGQAQFGNVERFFTGFLTAGWLARKL